MSPEIVNYIGYAASIFIVGSFALRKNLTKIRIVNLIGCLLFVVYAALADPVLWPVMIPNGTLCFIQIYHLLKKDRT